MPNPFRIYITLQGKGGCGKSLATFYIVQYLRSRGKAPIVIDADPVNKTLANFEKIGAEVYDIVVDQKVATRKFDQLIERILTTDSDFVIDNGAASFIPLSNYIVMNGLPDLLAANGRELVINTVVVGGESQADTFLALESLAARMPAVRIICWVNEFFGPVGGETSFAKTDTYRAVSDRLSGLVRLEKLPEEGFGDDFRRMTTAHLTFDEAIASPGFMIVEKQRLTMIRKNVFAEIEKARM